MIGFMERTMLKNLFRLTDEQVNVLEARLPDIINLIRVAFTHQDQFERVVKQVGPIVIQALEIEQGLKE